MLVYFVLTPILIGIFLQVFPFVKAGRIFAVTIQTVIFGYAAYLFTVCRNEEIVERLGGFENQLGITLRADTISSAFILLAAFIFLIAAIYSFNEQDSKLLWLLLFVWEGLLLGIFLTCDLFNIFILFEVVTLTVAVMIMFKRDSRSMYDGILYLMVNTVVVLFFLFGIGYLYKVTGSFDINTIAALLPEIDKSELTLPFALIMTAICLKCGLVPLHSWLPRAHGTPGSPPSVSAILSGLHVKTGIYLFMRFQNVFGEMFLNEIFFAIGIATGILGFVFAISQKDIKLMLAYHTISQIGLIMIGLCDGSLYSYTGALYHVFSHALFKSALFLCAGIIVKTYGTRDITKIRGVIYELPFVGVVVIMATLGITGAPFFNGSISKYFITAGADPFTNIILILINLGTIISFMKLIATLIGRPESPMVTPIERPDIFNQAAAGILGILCFLGGLFGENAIALLFNIELEIDIVDYIQKAILFVVSLIAGYIIYNFYVKNSRILNNLRRIDMGFRTICTLMGGFFAMLLIATRFL